MLRIAGRGEGATRRRGDSRDKDARPSPCRRVCNAAALRRAERGLVGLLGDHALAVRTGLHRYSEAVGVMQFVRLPVPFEIVIGVIESEGTVPGGGEVSHVRDLRGLCRISTAETR